MSDTPSGYPQPIDGKPYDSEAPTQLWQSPFRHLSQFPTRRAARRRERLEALLKGQEITNTGLLSSTNLTHTAATQDVSPLPLAENLLPDGPPPPESIPTGTYTSIRPVSGPRMAIFIAVGVAVGGLCALQLNRVLTPAIGAKADTVTASAPPPVHAVAVGPIVAEAPMTNAFEVEGCAPEEPKSASIPPLQVDVVAARPMPRTSKPAASNAAPSEQAAGPSAPYAVTAMVNSAPTEQSSCSRYPSVHIPTQLHPRINPLMTSNQVFSEQGVVKSNRHTPQR